MATRWLFSLNNGGGVFSSNATYAVGSYPLEVIAADLNNDGKMDLIGVNYFDSTLSVLTNATVFAAPISTPAPAIKRLGNGMLVFRPRPRRKMVLAAESRKSGQQELVAQRLQRLRTALQTMAPPRALHRHAAAWKFVLPPYPSLKRRVQLL